MVCGRSIDPQEGNIMGIKQVVGAIGAALLLGAVPAFAMPINGAVTVSDTFNKAFLPCTGGGIVRNCTSLEPLGLGNTGGGTDDFLGITGAAAVAAWIFATPGAVAPEISIPGFDFDITASGPIIQGPLLCGANACADALIVAISGIVTGAGFDPTVFTGTLTLTGACTGKPVAGDCNPTGSFSAGYSYSLAASGTTPPVIPEPGTLLLMGVALAGLGFVRRKKS